MQWIFSIGVYVRDQYFINGSAAEFELDSREEEEKEKVLDTSIWKLHLKAGNFYNYTINIENGKTGETTRKL